MLAHRRRLGDGEPVAARASSPVFLVGAPRSGTSLLYKALCLHPGVAWISNWVRRAPSLPQLALLNRVARRLPQTRRAAWFGVDSANAYVYGRRRPPMERWFPMPVEGEPVYRHCGIEPDDGTAGPVDPCQAACLRRAFGALSRYGGGRVLVSKRIANNQRIPLLVAAFPSARFVNLIRDGRAVACSLSRVDWWEDGVVWWYGGTARRWREEGGDPWELCARHWLRELASVEEGLRAVDAGRQLTLRYEELIEEPSQTLREVARFAGVPDDRGWVRELDRLRFPDRNDAWRERVGPAVGERLEAIQQEQLRVWGYVP
jgi:hypothetical protein